MAANIPQTIVFRIACFYAFRFYKGSFATRNSICVMSIESID